MQRVFEVQANWDQREKLRQFSMMRSPMIPPYQIQAPMYNPPNKIVHKTQENSNANYAFKEREEDRQQGRPDNDESEKQNKVNEKFLQKVKDKVEIKKSQLEKEVNETFSQISELKREKQEKRQKLIEAILLKLGDKALEPVIYIFIL
jgi:hypothetical protein